VEKGKEIFRQTLKLERSVTLGHNWKVKNELLSGVERVDLDFSSRKN
jgi:hypothetical protein